MTTRFPSLQEVARRKETLDWAQDKPDGGSPRQFLFPPVPATFCLTWIASEREDRQRRLPLPGSPLWVFSQLRKWPGHQEAVRPGLKPSLSDSQTHGCLCHSSNCMNWLKEDLICGCVSGVASAGSLCSRWHIGSPHGLPPSSLHLTCPSLACTASS